MDYFEYNSSFLDGLFSKEDETFLRDNYNHYSINELSYLLNVSITILKAYMEYKKIATYTLNNKYPDGYSFCISCKKILPYGEFYKKKSNKNGVQNICKSCDRLRKRNKLKPISAQKENIESKRKQFVINYIKTNYDYLTVKQIAKNLNLSISRIYQIASENEIKKSENNDLASLGCKKCNKCHRILPLSNFNKRSRTKDGYETTCKKCLSAYKKQRYEENNRKLNEKFLALMNNTKDVSESMASEDNMKDISKPMTAKTEQEKMKEAIANRYKLKTVSKKDMEKLKCVVNKAKETEEMLMTCTRCHKTKKGKDFYFIKRDRKRDSLCKKCRSELAKNNYYNGIVKGKLW